MYTTNNDNKLKNSSKNNVSYTNNNFNINFNNVIFCSQRISSASPDTNYNSINNIKNNNNLNTNNTNNLSNNLSSNLSNNNNLTQQNNNLSNNNIINKVNDNIYLSSLKSIYNSRNKHKMKASSLTQNKTGNGNIKTQSKNNKNSKDNNFKSYNSNNVPLNQKKYIIKENKLIDKNNSKRRKKIDFGHRISNQIEELIKNSHKVNFQNNLKYPNNNGNMNKEQNKEDKKDEINGNSSFLQKNKEKDNASKKTFSITSSMRGESIKNNNNTNKNFNLTSKNSSKIKHKKRISNYV